MPGSMRTTRFRFWLWLILLIGVIVPRLGRSVWRNVICGDAANARDRHPRGARRAEKGCATRNNPARNASGSGRHCSWPGRFCSGFTGYLKLVVWRESLDAVVFIGVSSFLATVALLASWLPAWRATKVDLLVALRYE